MFYLCSLNISSIFSSPSCMLTHVIQVQNWRKCVEFQPKSFKRRLEKLVYFFLLDCTWDMNLYATFPLKLGDLFTVLEGGPLVKMLSMPKRYGRQPLGFRLRIRCVLRWESLFKSPLAGLKEKKSQLFIVQTKCQMFGLFLKCFQISLYDTIRSTLNSYWLDIRPNDNKRYGAGEW